MRGYHEAVREFKRWLLTNTLVTHGGNRTHTARALGLQRTYLLRLIRQLGIDAPRPVSSKDMLGGSMQEGLWIPRTVCPTAQTFPKRAQDGKVNLK